MRCESARSEHVPEVDACLLAPGAARAVASAPLLPTERRPGNPRDGPGRGLNASELAFTQALRSVPQHGEKTGAEQVAHQGLLHRRHAQKASDQGPQKGMRLVLRLVQQLVLPSASFQALEQHPFERGLRMPNARLARAEPEGAGATPDPSIPRIPGKAPGRATKKAKGIG